MKYGTLPANPKAKIDDRFLGHTETIRGLQIAAANDATRLLFATNAGAAVALLAFMGNSTAVRNAPYARLSLIVFFAGIAALALLRAVNYHTTTGLLRGWVSETDKALKDETDVSAPFEWLQRKGKEAGLTAGLGYVSFACFIFGFLWSVCHFINEPPATSAPERNYAAKAACGSSSRDWFKGHGEVTRSFLNHYNDKLGRCFLLSTNAERDYVAVELVDVDENNTLGTFVQDTSTDRPRRCDVGAKQCRCDLPAFVGPFLP